MRLSDFAPRLNGIVPATITPGIPVAHGVGSLGDAVGDQITSYFNSFMANLQFDVEQGTAATPSVVQQSLVSAAQDSCAAMNSMLGSAGTCDPNSYATLILNYVAQYTAAYNNQIANTAVLVQSGQIAVPAGYVPPPNVLTSVAPTTVTVTTGQTSGNVLNPPVPMPPVTAGQVANTQTQGGSTTLATGTSGSNVPAPSTGILDWLTAPISTTIPIPMWAVLAGGVVAVMMVNKK